MIARKVKTNARNIIAAERRANAVSMRKSGMSLVEVAKAIGVDPSRVSQCVQESLDEVNKGRVEEHNEWYEHDWAITQELLNACLPSAFEGDLDAIDQAVKILARRAKMRGLDIEQSSLDIGEQPLSTYNRESLRELLIEGLRKQGRLIESTATPTKTNGDGNGN